MEASNNHGFHNPLPDEMLTMLSRLDKKVRKRSRTIIYSNFLKINQKTFSEIYNAFKNVETDRYDQRALYWLKESVLNCIDLFHDDNHIVMNTEQDLLEEVYGFIRRSRTLCSTKTET